MACTWALYSKRLMNTKIRVLTCAPRFHVHLDSPVIVCIPYDVTFIIIEDNSSDLKLSSKSLDIID